jgi:hypothetical protein
MKNLIKTLLIITPLFFSIDSIAQDTVKPKSGLTNKVQTVQVKQDKPVDALSSKIDSSKLVKKDAPTKKLVAPKVKAVLSEKKEIK